MSTVCELETHRLFFMGNSTISTGPFPVRKLLDHQGRLVSSSYFRPEDSVKMFGSHESYAMGNAMGTASVNFWWTSAAMISLSNSETMSGDWTRKTGGTIVQNLATIKHWKKHKNPSMVKICFFSVTHIGVPSTPWIWVTHLSGFNPQNVGFFKK